MILVTGNKGFIGSHIEWHLRSMGFPVEGIDKRDGKNILRQRKFDYDVIIHAAANLTENFEENITATSRLLSGYSSHFIFLSSAAVYGNRISAKEDDELNPFGKYGEAKAQEEEMVRNHGNHTILRLANVCGYGTDHGVHHLFMNGVNTINGDGTQTRDFVSVDDVVWMVLKAYWDGAMGTVNVGTDRPIPINYLFGKLNPGVRPVYVEGVDEIQYSSLNIDKARKNHGFVPKLVI